MARRKQKPQRLSYVFFALSALALAGILFFVIRTSVLRKELTEAQALYAYELSVTPVATPTIHAIDVTHDPSIITPSPGPTELLLSNGSNGEAVKQAQERLIELGFLEGEADGAFGSATRGAVHWFQAQHGLDTDGLIGPKTWEKLFSEEAQNAEATPTPERIEVALVDTPFLVNKANPVPEDFVPAGLVKIADVDENHVLILKDPNVSAVRDAIEALIVMVKAAQAQGISPWQVSEAYRSYEAQKAIFDRYVERYISNNGLSRANAISATRQTVADPGCSEHHTGLAFDLTVPNTDAFAYTAQYAWLARHCHEYGFVIRYTDEKTEITGFLGEEWHVRFVGVEHSMKMHELDLCLEEYLEYLEKNAE